jgi:hypothetical protein
VHANCGRLVMCQSLRDIDVDVERVHQRPRLYELRPASNQRCAR